MSSSGLLHFVLCCFKINSLHNCFITSTFLCIINVWLRRNSWWHSDSVLISDISLNVISAHDPFTVLMNCLMFTAVTDVSVYMYLYRYEYKCMSSKEISVKHFPVLPPVTRYEYQFCFHDMYFTLSNMFQQGGFQLLLRKSLLTWIHMYHI